MQKILIVDDSEINREILAAMLETEYEIDMAKGAGKPSIYWKRSGKHIRLCFLI